MSRPFRIALVALALTLAVTATAQAALVRFATPSRNIGCLANTGSHIRCDIRVTNAKLPPKPRSCRFDWGQAFGVGRNAARGRGLCVSDTVLPAPRERIRILAYGRTIALGNGLRCTSARVGLTCRNRRGHGFFLSRERIRLF